MRIEGERTPLRPSTGHSFWVKRGDAEPAWIESDKMRVGDLVETVQGNWRRVVAITPLPGQETVYNFTVDLNHDYFVGETGFLVHNECSCNWPPDHGFAPGTKEPYTLQPGNRIDRYGNPNGDMTAPAGTPFSERSLPASYEGGTVSTFEVLQPIQVLQGLSEPWFGQPGAGIQYEMPFGCQDMVAGGLLGEIE
jgi:hypothetical protein